jgi:hypothetical protein
MPGSRLEYTGTGAEALALAGAGAGPGFGAGAGLALACALALACGGVCAPDLQAAPSAPSDAQTMTQRPPTPIHPLRTTIVPMLATDMGASLCEFRARG